RAAEAGRGGPGAPGGSPEAAQPPAVAGAARGRPVLPGGALLRGDRHRGEHPGQHDRPDPVTPPQEAPRRGRPAAPRPAPPPRPATGKPTWRRVFPPSRVPPPGGT